MPLVPLVHWKLPYPAAALVILGCVVFAACGGDDSGGLTAPTTGTLEIRTVTIGEAPGEYTVSVDGGPPQPIGSNATLTISGLDPGSHSVQLGGLASGCTLSGQNPGTISVTAGSTSILVFTVTCAEPPGETGTLVVTTSTTGSGPDGYQISVDDGTPQPVGTTASVTLTGLTAGTHEVTLSGLAPNCAVLESNPQTVTITAGSSSTVAFTIVCAAATTPIAFGSNAPGLQAIFVVNPDGTELRSLTPEGGFDRGPVWSPDGSRMLFTSRDDLYVMNGDGSGRTLLADGDGFAAYRWSPDGNIIAFVAVTVAGADVFEDLWVMNADGTNSRELASNASGPSWSPDGSGLAYFSSSLSDPHIRIINLDGTGDRRLTNDPVAAFQPAWSPDGRRIAIVTLGTKDLLLFNPDGSGVVNLTPAGTDDDSPTWSPDGSRIAFNTGPENQPLESDIAVVNPDGSGRMVLTNNPGFDLSPSWSADGSRIVFESSATGNSEIFVMNADGTGQMNLTNRPGAHDTEPDWSRGSGSPTTVRMATNARELWDQLER
jgi:Tol biopolymer transport system component